MNETVAKTDSSAKPKFLLIALVAITVFLGCAVGGVWLYNETVLQKPLQRVLLSDSRNHVVQASAHFDGWVDTQTVVFDLTGVSGDASAMDVFRVLLQYAQEQKSNQYKRVILAAYGQRKFVMPGDYFQQLGREYATQNPIYTVRTLPHHVLAMDGSKPFPEVYGGLFYVLSVEMEQFKTFNERWFLNDYVARHK
jgi:hypothetical protein